jgi:hypothetical protein
MKQIQTVFFSLAVLAFSALPVRAEERLVATMGEVLLRNLQPGATYHLTSLLKFPLRISYEGKKNMTLLVNAAQPQDGEALKPGFEAIPDLSWVETSPTQFDLHGASTVEVNVSLFIPADEKLRGKKYAVSLVSQTMSKGEKGLSIGMGTRSQLLISIAKEKATSLSKTPASSYMSFRLEPGSVGLKGIRPGQRIEVGTYAKKELQIQNFGDEKKKFTLEIVRGEALDMTAPRGFEWGPESTVFEIVPTQAKIKKGRSEKYQVFMTVADQPAMYGKKFLYLLRVTPEGVGMSSGILMRINVETADR